MYAVFPGRLYSVRTPYMLRPCSERVAAVLRTCCVRARNTLRFQRVFMPSTRLVEGVENAGSVGCLFRARFHGVFMRAILRW